MSGGGGGAMDAKIFAQTLSLYMGPIQAYMDDPGISEVMINGAEDIWVERSGKLYKVDAQFKNGDHLLALAKNMAQYVGKQLNEKLPLMDGRLPDGSRIHITLPPVSRRGVCISIRKFFKEKLTAEKLIGFGSVSEAGVEFIKACVQTEKNTIVSGGTGSGKTSLLNVVSSMIDPGERILVLEDSSELQLQQPHVLNYETRAPDRWGYGEVRMRNLFMSAMRMRPDRVIIGEIRGGEALDLIQAMTSGHQGSLSTLHANNPTDAMTRLETMALMSELQLPLSALRTQIGSAVHVVIQTARFSDGSRKITHISEVLGLDEDRAYQTRDLFLFRATGKSPDGKILGSMVPTGHTPTFLNEIRVHGHDLPDEMKEAIRKRAAAEA